MNQSASASGDVHHQGMILAGKISIRRVGLFIEKALGVLLVTGFVLKEPDVEDFLGIFAEIGLF
jgi:hypothetical protein